MIAAVYTQRIRVVCGRAVPSRSVPALLAKKDRKGKTAGIRMTALGTKVRHSDPRCQIRVPITLLHYFAVLAFAF
jgi:hypothetical protein